VRDTLLEEPSVHRVIKVSDVDGLGTSALGLFSPLQDKDAQRVVPRVVTRCHYAAFLIRLLDALEESLHRGP